MHRINGLDQLDPPAAGRLLLFSLRMREEATASNTLVSLVETITNALGEDSDGLDQFESRLLMAGYSPLEADRYADIRFRVINERLYEVRDDFPRLSADSFAGGIPAGIEHVDYEINLDACPDAIVADSPSAFTPPPAVVEDRG